MAACGLRCYCADLPGHGASEGQRGHAEQPAAPVVLLLRGLSWVLLWLAVIPTSASDDSIQYTDGSGARSAPRTRARRTAG